MQVTAKASWFSRNWKLLLVGFYQALLLVFLLAELDVPWIRNFRATNQALLLVALLFLPYVLLASASVVQSIRVNLNGQEVEVQLTDLKTHLTTGLSSLKEDFSARVGDAEQVLSVLLTGNDPSARQRIERNELVFGAKDFRSSRLLAHLLGEWLHDSTPSVRCSTLWPNGSTLANFASLMHGRVDGYIEYTGTACALLGVSYRGLSLQQIVAALNARTNNSHGIRWLAPLGVRDDNRMVLLRSLADELGATTLSDLAAHAPKLALAAPTEFFSRSDGFTGLCHAYGLRFNRVENCGYSNKYEMLDSGRAHISLGWETDVELTNSDKYRAIEDDKQFFPSYFALPVMRIEALSALEGIESALTELAGKLDAQTLIKKVQLVTNRGDSRHDYREVAQELVRELKR